MTMPDALPANSWGHIIFDGTSNGTSSIKQMHLWLVTGSGAAQRKELRHTIQARDVGILDGISVDPYGRDCKCPPGNYFVGEPEACAIRQPDGSVKEQHDDDKAYGCWFTPLLDASPTGGMAEHDRAGIGTHAGGTAAAKPFAWWQGYYDTLGCFRLSNWDNEYVFVPFVRSIRASSSDPDRAVLFTATWGARAA